MYSALSSENKVLKKQLEVYYSQNNTLEKRVKRLERDIGFLKIKLEDLDECVNRETVVNLIQKIVFSINSKKGKDSSYLFKSSKDFNSIEIVRE